MLLTQISPEVVVIIIIGIVIIIVIIITVAAATILSSQFFSLKVSRADYQVDLLSFPKKVFNGGLQWHQLADGPCPGRPGAHSGAPHSRLEEQEEEQERGWSGAAGGSWAGTAGDD